MKTRTSFAAIACTRWLSLLLVLKLSAAVQAQFYYTTNNGTITITGYYGPGGDVAIPDTINGLSVTRIGDHAFRNCASLTSITIPDSVTSIGSDAFVRCIGLTIVTIGNSVTSIGDYAFNDCTHLTGVTIPDSVTWIGMSAFSGCTGLTNVTIGNSVTSIGGAAFGYCTHLTSVTIPDGVSLIERSTFSFCTGLTNVTIPSSVASIGVGAFSSCTILRGVYVKGNAPSLGPDVFNHATNATVYYLAGTIGWSSDFGGRPTALWQLPYPVILDLPPSFGVKTIAFGFIVSWAANVDVAVEACTNLTNPVWSPVATNTLTDGWAYFSDPDWTNHSARFYRLRSP